jgi:SulP family sulfate permease
VAGWRSPFRPRWVDCLAEYSGAAFGRDLTAGVTVGIISLPLAMAFAIASGVKPEAGLFTAIVAGFLISALGGSRVQIGGPTGAFVVLVAGIVAQHGPEKLAICTVMAGALLVAMALTGLGAAIKFIPHPVTSGFTSGIAVLILSTQLRDFLGLRMAEVPSEFAPKLLALAAHLGTWHPPTLALAAGSLVAMLAWPKRWGRRVPGTIVALVLATLLVAALRLPVETIGSRFGGIPRSLPAFHLPEVDFATLRDLVGPAFTIALLAGIESLLSAVVADGMTDDRHDSNQELMAQGVANLVAPLFGGIPATGAIARTATNVRSGARTPVAGMVHAATLLAVVLAAAPLAKFIPIATLSAVLIVVALNMGEWRTFRRLARWPKSDALVFLSVFALTILVDLTAAVEVGVVLAALLFVKRLSETTQILSVDEEGRDDAALDSLEGREVPDGVLLYRVFGAFFFGAADKLETALKRAAREPRVLVLRMRSVVAIDATGIEALEDLHGKLAARGKHLVLSGPHTQPFLAMDRAGLLDRMGRENVCASLDEALARARDLAGPADA